MARWPDFRSRPRSKHLCRQARRIKSAVFVKPPFGGLEQVLKYRARYTHLELAALSMKNGCVTFGYKDYPDGNESKSLTLEAAEFIRRFLLCILPHGFAGIRQFGFLAKRARGRKLALCRALLGVVPPTKPSVLDNRSRLKSRMTNAAPRVKSAVWFPSELCLMRVK